MACGGSIAGRCAVILACLCLCTSKQESCSIEDHEDGRCTRKDMESEDLDSMDDVDLEDLEIELGTAEVERPAAAASNELKVIFQNTADKDFAVYWVNPQTKQEVQITNCRAFGEAGLNTFVGHTFKLASADGDVHYLFMEKGKLHYTVPEVVETAPARKASGELDRVTKQRLNGFREGIGIMFRNLCDQDLIVFYEDRVGSVGIKTDVFAPGEDSTKASYSGHTFCFSTRAEEAKGCRDPVVKITVNKSQYAYPVECRGTHQAVASVREKWLKLDRHNRDYFAKTGIQWVGTFPQDPPVLHMHPASKVGDEIAMRTTIPLKPAPADMEDPSLLTLRVVSLEPRVFEIPKFLSAAEAKHIINLGKPKVRRSTAGNAEGATVSNTRTSKNTFVPRSESDIMDRVFARAADLLNVSDRTITHNSEQLQIVHYAVGQEYTPHHDWWHSEGGARFVTLLLYLNTPEAGGHTAFPKAKMPRGEPLVVPPAEGSAVLFYNKLPDGNSDDLALHCALPVHKGEKWLANFWVWDPKKS